MNRYKQFMMGLLVGSLCMLSVGAMANSSSNTKITAWLVDNVQFIFNGEYKSVPDEYSVLIYNDRTYVPTRFVAESLGAEVKWDEETRTATISSPPCPICPKEIVNEQEQNEQNSTEENKLDPNENEKESSQPSGDYRKLPITKYFQDQDITVTSIIRSGDFNNINADHKTHTQVHVRLENKGTNAIQLQQSKTNAIVDGKEYKTDGMPAHQIDQKWYDDLYEDDVVEGYIALPLIPEDAKEMKLILYVVENGWQQKEIEVEFDIALELNK